MTQAPNAGTHYKRVGEQLDAGLSFEHRLPALPTVLTVSPTLTVTLDTPDGASSSDLTISNQQINTVVSPINNKSVAIGRAVLWHVVGGVKGTTYNIRVASGTPSEPVIYEDCVLVVYP